MSEPYPAIRCPHCQSTAIAWTEHESLEGLADHATTVKCGSCEGTYSVEYEATAVSHYTEADDEWTTEPLSEE